jgi:hypothetical protein
MPAILTLPARRKDVAAASPARQSPPVMRRGEVEERAFRHDARRIDRGHVHVVVALDVIEAHRLGHARYLAKLAPVVTALSICAR